MSLGPEKEGLCPKILKADLRRKVTMQIKQDVNIDSSSPNPRVPLES